MAVLPAVQLVRASGAPTDAQVAAAFAALGLASPLQTQTIARPTTIDRQTGVISFIPPIPAPTAPRPDIPGAPTPTPRNPNPIPTAVPALGAVPGPLPFQPQPINQPVTPRTSPVNTGGLNMSLLPVVVPGAAIVIRTAAQLTRLGAGTGANVLGGVFGAGGSSILQRALQVIGVASIADLLGFNIFGGRNDEDQLLDLVEELVASGFIQTPSARRDGTTGSNNWLHWDIGADDSRPFLTSEYIGRGFVNAVRKNERTPRYTSRPRPRGRARRSS